MQLSKRTLEILRNFSLIRPTITIEPGNLLKTMSPSFGIRAFATVEEEFPVPCVLHDVSRLLNLINMADNTEFTWGKKFLKGVQSDGGTIMWYYSQWGSNGPPEMIKRGDTSNPLIQFRLTNDVVQKIRQGLSGLRYDTLAFVGEKGVLGVAAVGMLKNVVMPTSYSIPIGETSKTFRVYINLEKLKIIDQDYDVTIIEKRFVHFAGQNIDYYISMDMASEFGA